MTLVLVAALLSGAPGKEVKPASAALQSDSLCIVVLKAPGAKPLPVRLIREGPNEIEILPLGSDKTRTLKRKEIEKLFRAESSHLKNWLKAAEKLASCRWLLVSKKTSPVLGIVRAEEERISIKYLDYKGRWVEESFTKQAVEELAPLTLEEIETIIGPPPIPRSAAGPAGEKTQSDEPAPVCEACGGTSMVKCPVCKGKRKIDAPCPRCRGTGEVTCGVCSGSGAVTCPTCKGKGRERRHTLTGEVFTRPCPTCRGSGRVQCYSCRGAGKKRCPRCKGKKTVRVTCPRCRGRGKIPCPLCGAADQEEKVKPGESKAKEKTEEGGLEDLLTKDSAQRASALAFQRAASVFESRTSEARKTTKEALSAWESARKVYRKWLRDENARPFRLYLRSKRRGVTGKITALYGRGAQEARRVAGAIKNLLKRKESFWLQLQRTDPSSPERSQLETLKLRAQMLQRELDRVLQIARPLKKTAGELTAHLQEEIKGFERYRRIENLCREIRGLLREKAGSRLTGVSVRYSEGTAILTYRCPLDSPFAGGRSNAGARRAAERFAFWAGGVIFPVFEEIHTICVKKAREKLFELTRDQWKVLAEEEAKRKKKLLSRMKTKGRKEARGKDRRRELDTETALALAGGLVVCFLLLIFLARGRPNNRRQ